MSPQRGGGAVLPPCRRWYALALLCARALAAAPLPGAAAAAAAPAASVQRDEAHDTGAPLAELARGAAARTAPQRMRVFPLRLVTPAMRGRPPAPARPPSAAAAAGAEAATSAAAAPRVNTGGTLVNIDGVGANSGAPSDANGAVGASQYVQWVNTELAVYDKAGALLLGPVQGKLLFAGFTGSRGADACRLSNRGDPIAQYDKLAGRWVLSQFAWLDADEDSGPYYQCIAVSTSADATGSYHRYVFESRDAANAIVFNDYAKMGIWPDAYYLTYVLFAPLGGKGYFGPQVCGYDRAAMLAGAAALGRCHDLGDSFGPVLPADLDGTTPPPAGSANYLLSMDFDGAGHGDTLFLWRYSFAADSLGGPQALAVAPYTIACPSTFGGPCVRQPPPGEPLDSLGDRLMYRLPYRNFGDRQVLLANHSVQQPGAPADGPLGVRWYELRAGPGAAAGVAVYQQGSHAPDTLSRWMASIAMDRAGDIALGYSVAGAALFPGVRYSGRLRSELPGTLEAEAAIVAGAGVQIDTFNRWGDYSGMTVDPVDDCTFWYTQQYIANSGRFTWRSRIAAFRFRNCD